MKMHKEHIDNQRVMINFPLFLKWKQYISKKLIVNSFLILFYSSISIQKVKSEKLEVKINWNIGAKIAISPSIPKKFIFNKCEYRVVSNKIYEEIIPGTTISYGFYIGYLFYKLDLFDLNIEFENNIALEYFTQKDICSLYTLIYNPITFCFYLDDYNVKLKWHTNVGYICFGKVYKRNFINKNLNLSQKPTNKDYINVTQRNFWDNFTFGGELELFFEFAQKYNVSILISSGFYNVSTKKNINEELIRVQLGISLGYNFKKMIEQSIKNYKTRRLFTLKR